MNKLIVANWKLNPLTEQEAVRLAKASDRPGVVIAAPFPLLAAVKSVIRKTKLGAQDVSAADIPVGPRTGEVSAAMLMKLGVRYVIVGHSERRRPSVGGGESDATVAAKLSAAFTAGLTPILCVGEPWAVRRRGFSAATVYVRRQLAASLQAVESLKFSAKGGSASDGKVPSFLVAYEPVWAISTSKERRAETPEDAALMAQFITRQLTINNKQSTNKQHKTPKVLYGGSVNAKNAASFMARPEFAGVLVGGASLKPKEFQKITNFKYQIPNKSQ